MLTVNVEPNELYIEKTNEFWSFDGGVLQLEHSLISIRKWESKWHIPFLEEEDKTPEQIKDYIRCMTINNVKNPDIYEFLTQKNINDIIEYIKDSMTATFFSNKGGLPNQNKNNSNPEKITAEVVYCWMIMLNIPIEFERWHINQLITLIRVVNIKANPSKMSHKDAAMQRQMLNAQRRAKYKTRG